jgi:hypothetical protein
MEQQWEHKIAEAYNTKDANTTYPNKDKLWNRISGEIRNFKGGSTLWKVAAILLVFVMFGGVFASISVLNTQNKKMAEIENRNLKLQHTVDSLLNIVPEKITEIQIVEKEKLIYKEVFVPVQNESTVRIESAKPEAEIKKLNEQLLVLKQNNQSIKDSLLIALSEIKMQEKITQDNSEEKRIKFKLKPEKVKDQMQENITGPTPKMKIQLFKLQKTDIKFDTNSTLLKK